MRNSNLTPLAFLVYIIHSNIHLSFWVDAFYLSFSCFPYCFTTPKLQSNPTNLIQVDSIFFHTLNMYSTWQSEVENRWWSWRLHYICILENFQTVRQHPATLKCTGSCSCFPHTHLLLFGRRVAWGYQSTSLFVIIWNIIMLFKSNLSKIPKTQMLEAIRTVLSLESLGFKGLMIALYLN